MVRVVYNFSAEKEVSKTHSAYKTISLISSPPFYSALGERMAGWGDSEEFLVRLKWEAECQYWLPSPKHAILCNKLIQLQDIHDAQPAYAWHVNKS